eukprot:TRINITY_DN4363_c0_g4_i1.p2 TRINITY_DN4363_c0_g4~~TRINITY_DN4363_c0_g4_i1.p2  ORF type:complete len:133 (+),score=17.47 TRINITY_DN4363_c0_g4_i1:78-476(+)
MAGYPGQPQLDSPPSYSAPPQSSAAPPSLDELQELDLPSAPRSLPPTIIAEENPESDGGLELPSVPSGIPEPVRASPYVKGTVQIGEAGTEVLVPRAEKPSLAGILDNKSNDDEDDEEFSNLQARLNALKKR